MRAALIGLARHVRAVPAYSKLLGDMEEVDKAIDLLAAPHPSQLAESKREINFAHYEAYDAVEKQVAKEIAAFREMMCDDKKEK